MRIKDFQSNKWRFSIDRGGTFTDIIGIGPEGNIHTAKLLSESSNYTDSAIEGIRQMLHLSPNESIPEDQVSCIRMGTTVATNALLERKGVRVSLFITKGFRDILEIGYQNRPELFKLVIKKPEQLYQCIKEVDERIDYSGKIINPLNNRSVEKDLIKIKRTGINSIAIVLLHSWKNGIHEKMIAGIAKKLGFNQISVSHEIMPLIKVVGRGQTTVVDAYLSPVLKSYINSVKKYTGEIQLEFMQSSGGITDAEMFTGKDAIISGPAGGVIGLAAVTNTNKVAESIGIDMGGTSTDVSRYGGIHDKVFEVTTAGIQFQTPSMNILTVAAGGGSILRFDGQKLRVGPESAGADPGPACYGHGGPLTITDANLLLGRILPSYFPSTFGTNRDQPLDLKITQKKFEEITASINKKLGTHLTTIETALGFVKIANETMAKPIKEISISRGFDVRKHVLVCFGGAAPQHACAIARILGIQKVIIHPLAGLLSAYGIAMADYSRYALKSIVGKLNQKLYNTLDKRFEILEDHLKKELINRHIPEESIEIHRFLDIRPLGTDTFLSIRFTDYNKIEPAFHKAYKQHFGFKPSGVPLELVNIRVEVIGKGKVFQETEIKSQEPRFKNQEPRIKKQVQAATDRNSENWLNESAEKIAEDSGQPNKMSDEVTKVYFNNDVTGTPVYKRENLEQGKEISGPAIIVEDYSTIVIEPGFTANINEYRHLIIEQKVVQVEKVSTKRDPIMLEVFNHLFMSVAEQMGNTLQNTAHSTNIKERLDFSCAIFDSDGNLVANAPHIPVHLGAMGESVKSVIDANQGQMLPGDVYVSNNPYKGGSHLPDVTVISPVFPFENTNPTFFTASRGHHADIGGITPGSMPPFATSLHEEGIVIDNFLLVRNGHFQEEEIRDILLSSIYPARNIGERISDLKAQIAANNMGVKELKRLVDKYSLETVLAYMQHIRDNAAEAMREALGRFLHDSKIYKSHFEDFLDDRSKIAVSIKIEKGNNPPHSHSATIDFSGTSRQITGNLNAPVAVTKAAVLYVFRTLIEEDIPLNSGCLHPITIIIPKGCLLNPSENAAVVGGNVETSQRIVDTLLGALCIAAASQGTMNNFLFGREDGKGKQYYETIAGGSGATDGFPGANAVQVHMTNTRITDPEVLEQRYPELRLERFSIRKGSGGKGKYRGGDGTIRKIRFLQPRKVSILSERRVYPPYGLSGGMPGAKGINILVTKYGVKEDLGGKVELVVNPGEKILIKTPGGGGFGKP